MTITDRPPWPTAFARAPTPKRALEPSFKEAFKEARCDGIWIGGGFIREKPDDGPVLHPDIIRILKETDLFVCLNFHTTVDLRQQLGRRALIEAVECGVEGFEIVPPRGKTIQDIRAWLDRLGPSGVLISPHEWPTPSVDGYHGARSRRARQRLLSGLGDHLRQGELPLGDEGFEPALPVTSNGTYRWLAEISDAFGGFGRHRFAGDAHLPRLEQPDAFARYVADSIGTETVPVFPLHDHPRAVDVFRATVDLLAARRAAAAAARQAEAAD